MASLLLARVGPPGDGRVGAARRRALAPQPLLAGAARSRRSLAPRRRRSLAPPRRRSLAPAQPALARAAQPPLAGARGAAARWRRGGAARSRPSAPELAGAAEPELARRPSQRRSLAPIEQLRGARPRDRAPTATRAATSRACLGHPGPVDLPAPQHRALLVRAEVPDHHLPRTVDDVGHAADAVGEGAALPLLPARAARSRPGSVNGPASQEVDDVRAPPTRRRPCELEPALARPPPATRPAPSRARAARARGLARPRPVSRRIQSGIGVEARRRSPPAPAVAAPAALPAAGRGQPAAPWPARLHLAGSRERRSSTPARSRAAGSLAREVDPAGAGDLDEVALAATSARSRRRPWRRACRSGRTTAGRRARPRGRSSSGRWCRRR